MARSDEAKYGLECYGLWNLDVVQVAGGTDDWGNKGEDRAYSRRGRN